MSLTGLHGLCCLVDGSGKACVSTVNTHLTQWGLDELYCDHCQKHAVIVKHWALIKLMRKFCSCHRNYADATVRFTSSGDCPQHCTHHYMPQTKQTLAEELLSRHVLTSVIHSGDLKMSAIIISNLPRKKKNVITDTDSSWQRKSILLLKVSGKL